MSRGHVVIQCSRCTHMHRSPAVIVTTSRWSISALNPSIRFSPRHNKVSHTPTTSPRGAVMMAGRQGNDSTSQTPSSERRPRAVNISETVNRLSRPRSVRTKVPHENVNKPAWRPGGCASLASPNSSSAGSSPGQTHDSATRCVVLKISILFLRFLCWNIDRRVPRTYGRGSYCPFGHCRCCGMGVQGSHSNACRYPVALIVLTLQTNNQETGLIVTRAHSESECTPRKQGVFK